MLTINSYSCNLFTHVIIWSEKHEIFYGKKVHIFQPWKHCIYKYIYITCEYTNKSMNNMKFACTVDLVSIQLISKPLITPKTLVNALYWANMTRLMD